MLHFVQYIHSQIALSEYTFSYSGSNSPPPCYLSSYETWKTSHGSPCYVKDKNASSGFSLLLEATNSGTKKSEGAFVNNSFSGSRKYKIEVFLTEKNGKPISIELYGASGLTAKIDTTCSLASFPSVADKDLIGGFSGDCGIVPSLPDQQCTITIPTNNTLWNPKKNCDQFWITSNHAQMSSYPVAYMINKIVVWDYGYVNNPYPPENLRVTSVSGSSITVVWEPPSKSGDYPFAKYEVFRGNSSVASTTNTTYTLSRLDPCKEYTIHVKSVDTRDNYSLPATVNAQTSAEGNKILDSPVILSTYPQKRLVVEAENYILLQPGFSVAATNTQEYFKAMIGCENASREDLHEDEDDYNFFYNNDDSELPVEAPFFNDSTPEYVEDVFIDYSIGIVASSATKELLIYPNPTSDAITIEYLHYTGTEKITLFDITGRPLLDRNLSDYFSTIDISSFSKGVYFIKVITQESIFVKKLIKM